MRSEILGMWYIGEAGCSGCLGCAMFGMCGMGCLPESGVLFYKIPLLNCLKNAIKILNTKAKWNDVNDKSI